MARDDADRMEVHVDPHDCGTMQGYNEFYDAYFCPTCDVWTSAACSATTPEECGFDCWKRPERPSQTDE